MKTHPRFAVLVLASLALAAPAARTDSRAVFPEFQVNTSPIRATTRKLGDVASGDDGGFIVTWSEYRTTRSWAAASTV